MAVNNYQIDSNRCRTFPRFFLAKDSEPRVYWTGTDWSEIREKALVYSDPDATITDIQKFRVQDYGPCQTHTFEMPMTIQVYAHQDVDIEDLKQWLKKAMGFYLDVHTHGDGPNGSLVGAVLEIEQFKRAK